MNELNDLKVLRVQSSEDFARLAEEIKAADWNEENDMGDYTSQSLQAFVANDRRVLVTARRGTRLAGIASATIQLKPYEHELWLYVDEVDVPVTYRNQGIGKAMMTLLLSIAKEQDCTELWLGTERDNEAALNLYKSLEPDETEPFVGFTFRF
jgi:ribosomal protein S18 acetylase RimI-like enzyme